MKRPRNARSREIAETHHLVRALGSKADLAVLIGERRDVVWIAAHDRAKRFDAGDLILAAHREMDEHRPVVVARVAPQVGLERVENAFQPLVPVHMDVYLVTGVPIDAERALEDRSCPSSTRRCARRDRGRAPA